MLLWTIRWLSHYLRVSLLTSKWRVFAQTKFILLICSCRNKSWHTQQAQHKRCRRQKIRFTCGWSSTAAVAYGTSSVVHYESDWKECSVWHSYGVWFIFLLGCLMSLYCCVYAHSKFCWHTRLRINILRCFYRFQEKSKINNSTTTNDLNEITSNVFFWKNFWTR